MCFNLEWNGTRNFQESKHITTCVKNTGLVFFFTYTIYLVAMCRMADRIRNQVDITNYCIRLNIINAINFKF